MFITRLLSGIVLLLVSFGCIYMGGYTLAGFLMLLSLQAWFELGRVFKPAGDKKINSLMVWGYISIIAYYVCIALCGNTLVPAMAGVLGFIGFLVVYVFSFPKYEASQIAAAVFSFLYAPVMLSFVAFTRGLENGIYIVWMIYIAAWGSDTMAYCVGMLTGKTIGNHKMTPKLSPKKSIEGAVGGVLGAALFAWLYAKFVMGPNVEVSVNIELMLPIIGALGAFMAMIGDLAASAIKRNKDIKDYGHCIPGHGGIMDRFDSMIFTAPLTYFLSAILLSVL